ncbi:unnamed protein product [Caenorhabditis auriculariae]|uniref:Uncharacterized protein n=1 Tax=Caenorhabditis auriculariae TaxID=2777116 RepID=A0A8S1HDV1_9PELO|nr:unnamed protein product [Caenorhabditis auriculariae]
MEAPSRMTRAEEAESRHGNRSSMIYYQLAAPQRAHKMFWRLFSPASARCDDRREIRTDDTFLFCEAVVAEVDAAVAELETAKEEADRQEREKHRLPDYTWLATGKSSLYRKRLNIEEKARVENACERLRPEEWSKTVRNWRSRIENAVDRKTIVDEFLSATHQSIVSRQLAPPPTVMATPPPAASTPPSSHREKTLTSSRSVAQLSIIELSELV